MNKSELNFPIEDPPKGGGPGMYLWLLHFYNFVRDFFQKWKMDQPQCVCPPSRDGQDGKDGYPGATGATGATGAAGATGATGATGADGANTTQFTYSFIAATPTAVLAYASGYLTNTSCTLIAGDKDLHITGYQVKMKSSGLGDASVEVGIYDVGSAKIDPVLETFSFGGSSTVFSSAQHDVIDIALVPQGTEFALGWHVLSGSAIDATHVHSIIIAGYVRD